MTAAMRERRLSPESLEGWRSAADLQGLPVPPRKWHVEGFIPGDNVTLLGGDGGTGKSLVAMQLAAATAARRTWLGRTCTEGGAIYLSAEDDETELHRRLADICTSGGFDLGDLGQLTLRSLAGEEALLAVPHPRSGVLQPTPLFAELEERVASERPAILVLDTLADLHSGPENDRTTARQFIGMIRGLAIRQACAVLVLAHPSLTGMSTGSGLSGSTAWSNSVRSRLYLERIILEGHEPDPDRRRLVVKKANHAPIGGEITLRWQAGAFVMEGGEAAGNSLDRIAAGAKAERVFLKLLDAFEAQGRFVSPAPSTTYAPTLFAKHPDAEGCKKRALAVAMEALLRCGRIVTAEHGRGASTRRHLTRGV